MALHIGEEEVWKCPKHPSKRRRNTNGICPTCLRERLGILCPECANIRPCACCATATSSSSSSSSFSIFSSFSSSARTTAPYDIEPRLLKSRSVAVPFMRSRFSASGRENFYGSNDNNKVKTRSFWSSFKSNNKSVTENKNDGHEEWKDGHHIEDLDEKNMYYNSKIGDFERMMVKSRSMRAPISSEMEGGGGVKSSTKGKLWHFPSPIKLFRHRSKVVQDRSSLQGY